MINLVGSIFKHPMEYNQVTLSGNYVRIHNTDNTGFGYIQQYRNPKAVNEEISFILNKKNYTLLGNLSEFELEKKGNVITVVAKDFKAKFADMADVHPFKPNIDDMQPLDIKFNDIYIGRNFGGAPDKLRYQFDGITVRKEGVIASTGYKLFINAMYDEDRPEINIPLDTFKRLDSGVDYKIKTNGQIIVFINGGQAYYSFLIETLLKFVHINDPIVEFMVSEDELIRNLKLIKNYTDTVHIVAEGTVLKLSAAVEMDEINMNLTIKPINLKRIVIDGNINNLLTMFNAVEEDKVLLNVTKNMMYVKKGNITAASCLIVCEGMEVSGNG